MSLQKVTLKVLIYRLSYKLRSYNEASKEMLIHSADPRLLKVTEGYCIEVIKELRSKIEPSKGNTQGCIKVISKLRSMIKTLKEMLIHSADPRLLKVTKGYCIEVMKELRSKIEASKGNTQGAYIQVIRNPRLKLRH